ncbi:RTC4-like domain-containing protein [Exophiala viscosa]|uniref:Restriction of telomere capping protein 4 n=2 Tax=Exophiala viscosa TaxID=2486360 RepID=A0AAN6E5L2_9EURO|nr:RTC4-like domain-containing protein [Exophiala viscosa]
MKSSTQGQDDFAVYGPPQGSSDEEGFDLTEKPTKTSTNSRTSLKRPSSTAAASRSKRRKGLADEPSLEIPPVPEADAMADLFLEPKFKSSQKRKLQQTYGNRSFRKPETIEPRNQKIGVEQGFVAYDEVQKHDTGPDTKDEFRGIAALPEKRVGRGVPKLKDNLDIADLPEALPVRKGTGFRIPVLPDITSSAATSATDAASIFDAPLSPDKLQRKRAGSTSSLSSADSMFILENQAELLEVFEPTDADTCCPVCQKPVKDSMSLFVPDNLQSLSFKQQQNFCTQHQLVDAEELWRRRGFPDINWKELEETRVPDLLPLLKEIINRQKPSFYLDELDRRIKAARGNRKTIHKYLNHGIVDVAKQGYYGPKGARIMVTAITQSLTDTLNKALQSDSVLRAAGVGGYLSAVLVPELTLQLVMKDMKLEPDQETEGRKILEESTTIGDLLSPDDERLEREDGD